MLPAEELSAYARKENEEKVRSLEESRRPVREYREGRGRFTRVFETAGGEKAAVIYPEPVHYQKEGKWEEIDNSLVRSGDGRSYQNTAGELKVRLAGTVNAWTAAEKAGTAMLASVERDGYTLSWGLEAEGQAESAFQLDEDKEDLAGVKADSRQMFAAKKLHSGGVFPDILPGTDIRYRLGAESLKEEILLKERKAAGQAIRFRLMHKGMKADCMEDGSLRLYEADGKGRDIFFLEKPILVDANHEISEGEFALEAGPEGESTLKITWDADWMASEKRAFPVIVDPTVKINKATTSIDDAFVRSRYPDGAYGWNYPELEVGRNYPYEICRVYIRFNQLPTLEKGAVITDARMNLYQYQFSANNGQGFNVSAHQVTGSWDQRTITWNNKPAFAAAALDYVKLEATNGSAVPKSFDVTKLVKSWYNNPSTNYGIMLKAVNETPYATATLISSDTPLASYGLPADCLPTGVVYYRSTKGLEGYYSYHKQELGRTGTGYVNRYNGNLVFVHPTEGTTGNLLPVSHSLVYNLCDCSTASRFGKGFKSSLMMELKASGNADFPYVLTDADGTNHYFYRDTADGNKLKDEDGLGLIITQTSSSVYNAYMVMEDKDKVKYIFGQDSYLRQVKDTYNNVMECQYGAHSNGNSLDRAIDPTGAMVEFFYDSAYTRLDHIRANGRLTHFTYDASGHLTGITYPDGKTSTFAYSGDRLLYAQGPDGYRITYGYLTDCGVDRVSQVQEGYYPASGSAQTGTAIQITYPMLGTTVFTEPGLDGQIGTGADNRVYTWKFDRHGSPAEILDNFGHVVSAEYYDGDASRHKLRQTALTGKVVDNLLKNSGFDSISEFNDETSPGGRCFSE